MNTFIICKNCNEPFYKKENDSNANFKRRLFCSPSCASLFNNKARFPAQVIERYCLHCNSLIPRVKSDTNHSYKIKKFCSMRCSAFHSNLSPNRKSRKKPRICTNCSIPLIDTTKRRKLCPDCLLLSKLKPFGRTTPISEDTKREIFSRSSNWQSARSTIVKHATKQFKKSLKSNSCANCGYRKHTEVCHIKSVSSFADEIKLAEINHIDNLVSLCPNCHWEYDNGLLTL